MNFDQKLKLIRDTHNKLRHAAQPPQGSVWLLDNYYIIERCIKNLKLDFKKHSYENARSHARQLVKESQCKIDQEVFTKFITKKQTESPLSSLQLASFPSCVKAAIIEEVCAACHDIKEGKETYIGNAVLSLMAMEQLDFDPLYRQINKVDSILSQDPIFAKSDSKTKEVYRKRISHISRKFSIDECAIATECLNLAFAATSLRQKNVGYYIVDKGVKKLLAKFKKRHLILPCRTAWYITAILLIAIAISFLSVGIAPLILAALLPAIDIAITLVNRFVMRITAPRFLSRISLKDGVPKEGKTLIAFPCLLLNQDGVKKQLEMLEVCYLSNSDPNINLALVGDFRDHTDPTAAGDNDICDKATEIINSLNQKYGNKFFYFHRERIYNPRQGKWIGYERKRGALMELNKRLLGRGKFHVEIGDMSALKGTKYVITLDADTVLSMGEAKKLIGIMLHPLNKPTTKNGIVTEGSAVVIPRINVGLEHANRTLFSKIFAGQGGIDPYTTAVSDVYHDAFGEGIFTGKGIYDVGVFMSVLDPVIPDNTILSHDLLEGEFLRVGIAADCQVLDGYPARYNAYASRLHRWIRGDWQLLPYLGIKITTKSGSKITNPLRALSRWKILDNMRRSLKEASMLIALILGFCLETGSGLIALTLIAVALPLLLYAYDSCLSGNFHNFSFNKKRHNTIIYGFKGFLYQVTISFATLAFISVMSLDGALKGMWRSITKKRTLEWVTAEHQDNIEKNTLLGYYRKMFSTVVIGAILPSLTVHSHGLSLIFSIVWVLAPALMYILSYQPSPLPYRLSNADRDKLMDIARRTYRYFEDFSSEDDNHIPADNYQQDPGNIVSHRTSPTNIGLAVCSHICAFDLGFIDKQQMKQRIENTINIVEKMEKWKGHLFNWYDTKTLEPLFPRYVSFVDSGNMIGYFMVAAKALADQGIHALAERIYKLISETDFLPLYDNRKKLFSIGFNIDENRLTNNYYDLMASEARQASFVCIALGITPVKHWFRLSRSLTKDSGYVGMMSWTGTMFEYLMPLLIMKNYKNTLWDESYNFCLMCQKKYGKKRAVPWGVSESGFFQFDINLNYQYKAMGVPALGLKRGLSSDMVVAPYATMLGLMVDTHGSLQNLESLEKLGMLGEYGYYEAIDFTPSRLISHSKSKNNNFQIVKSFMSHHQGMGLMSITNVLKNNIMQERFHSIPHVKKAELLLQERVPINPVITLADKERISPLRPLFMETKECVREQSYKGDLLSKMHILSNGSYNLVVDERGNGYSWLRDITLGRFRRDPYETYGQRLFVDLGDGVMPLYCHQSVFSPHKAEFINNFEGLTARTHLFISPEDSVEIRRIVLINNSHKPLNVSVTGFMELALSSLEADSAHMAFSKLFIVTEHNGNSMIATRRPREEGGKEISAFQSIFVEGNQVGDTTFETSRSKFIGRGNTIENAHMLTAPLSDSFGSVLDACFAFRTTVAIPSSDSATITLVTGMDSNVERLIEKYSNKERFVVFEELAYKRACVASKFLELKDGYEESFLSYLPYLLFGGFKSQEICEAMGEHSIADLWKLGISGDRHIVVLKIWEEAHISSLECLLKCHEYYRSKGLIFDLCILVDEPAGYSQPIYSKALEIIDQSHARDMKNNCVYLLNSKEIEDSGAVMTWGQLYFHGDSPSPLPPSPSRPLPYKSAYHREDTTTIPDNLKFENGYGGFTDNEYVIVSNKKGFTPLPWANVVANPKFGFIATESGGGYTYSQNSRENKLTIWSNDPIQDLPSETIYIGDGQDIFCVTPAPIDEKGKFICVHGMGYTTYRRSTRDLDMEQTLFVPVNESIKLCRLKIKNNDKKDKKLRISYAVMPVMGVDYYKNRAMHHSRLLGQTLCATCCGGLAGETLFVDCTENIVRFNTSRHHFNLEGDFDNKVGKGYEHHLAISVEVTLQSGQENVIGFVLGAADHQKQIEELTRKYRDINEINKSLEDAIGYWRNEFEILKVKTPSESMNLMLNGRLQYQSMACRLFARSAFYQAGGAFGFRDQLQDVLCCMYSAPHLSRQQIIEHAAHQFEEGDCLHWWHTPFGRSNLRGVRTRFSDDRLWLVYVLCDYIRITDDKSILEHIVGYLDAPPLKPHEDERYSEIQTSSAEGSIYQHAVKAIDISLNFGEHGLPLMGSGDWNDGMNMVGNKGKGQSVWLGWFLADILEKFIPICEFKGDNARAREYKQHLDGLKVALDQAYDGQWYRRAYFDNGQPLGSEQCAECKIDSLSQSWAVISGFGHADKVNSAMDSLEKYLVDRELGIIKLLTPPFEKMTPSPGYIKSYVKGVRENGGQYTHAAVWAGIAYAMLKEREMAMEVFDMINPISHTSSKLDAMKYKVEPYVLAADVYTAQGHEGRGGWSFYTGAGAWMYRFGIEHILGFKKQGDKLTIDAAVRDDWKEYCIEYRYISSVYKITIKNKGSKNNNCITLVNDGKEHALEVWI